MALTQEQFMQLMGGKREPVTASVASVLDLIKKPLDYYAVDKRVPLVGGQSAADLIGLTGTQSLVQDFSQGKPMMRDGLPDERFIDLAGFIPMVKPVAVGVGKATKYLGKEALRQGYEGTGLLGKTAPDIKMPIIAWHGSPYKFDKFDPARIGSGEGKQLYGHGLYFSESPSVAEAFKMPSKGVEAMAATNLEQYKSPEMAIAALARQVDSNITGLGRKAAQDAIDLIKSGKATTGNLYKVDIEDKAIPKMLDFDKPLYRQPQEIKELALEYAPALKNKIDMTGDTSIWNLTGADLFGAMQRYSPGGESTIAGITGQDVTRKLLEKGIPGSRYLGHTSRVDNAGTKNYVVFDPNTIKILERNGLLLP